MGEHAAITARRWDIGRAEQDELAAASHRHLAAAYERGFLDDLLTPYRGLTRDQNLRPDSTPEKLARLKPVFGTSQEGATMTAGNSTPLTDGAALVLLASDAWAQEHGLEPLAYLTAYETAAVPFVRGEADGDEGLLMAPVHAAPRMLKRAGLNLAEDFDLYEIHEAFASQVLATLAAWEAPAPDSGPDVTNLGAIDRGRLNVAGSSLATGHPFAATGARILGLTAKLLQTEQKQRALISVCTAGGMGVAAILESAKAAEMRVAA
jgi:acetyl-CoA C-acetyltransferase